LPSYVADLNRLAESFADRVNGILAAGVDVNGDTPAVDLFTFDAANGSALTLAVTEMTPEQIAAALPEAPGGNSNSLNLAALATSGEIDGFTFTEFYGRLGSRVGQGLANARREERSQSLLLSQAQNLRSQVSAVSLDEEAAALIEFQRSYQASAQLFRVLNEMTEVVFTLLR